MLQAIETNYDGHRFRSRTEARWAVFFNNLGWRYEYEKEGFVLDGKPYLPDFYLPDVKIWLEVKGIEPTEREFKLATALAEESGDCVLVAVGAPGDENLLVAGKPRDSDDAPMARFMFLADRRNAGEFWIGGECDWWSIGPIFGPDHERLPIINDAMRTAYRAAMSARFEHGETPF